MNNHLFVYGTLMKKFTGYKPIMLEEYGEYVCEGFIYGRLYEIDNYPGLILGKNINEKVYGEIFLLNDFNTSILKLDEYEDFFPGDFEKSLYIRQIEDVNVQGGDIKKAWVYIFNEDVDEEKRVISGNYIDYLI